MEFQVPLNENPELTKKLNKFEIRKERTATGAIYTISLDDDIDEPKRYRQIVTILREAEVGDEIVLQVASWGGYLDGAILLINELLATKALTKAIIHTAGSAATLIAFACDEVKTFSFATIMVHNFSVSQQGKGREIRVKAEFDRRQFELLCNKLYAGILTDKEISDLQDDQDIWLLGGELLERMNKYGWQPIRYRMKEE